ncbi:methyl-accepting chemotaxis protein [Achromobacter xylosoxidans]
MLVARDNTFDQVDHNIGQITRNHANELSAWVRDKQRVTSSLKNAVDQPEAIAHTMAATAQQAGGFDDAYIVYADKRYIFNHAMPDGFDGPARAWYQQAAQTNGPAITPIYVDAASGKLCMSFVEAVREPRGRAVGTDMLLDSMAKMVAAIQATPKSFAFLLDGQGQILAHPDVKLALKPVTAIDPGLDLGQLQQLARNSGSSLTQDIGGVSQLLYASAVEGTPWTLVIAIDRAQANEPVTMMVKLAASITALALLLAVAFVTMAVKRQLRGLPQVQYALQDIASGDGDLTRRLPAEGGDELARIGAAFNQFADKIATILREIRVATDSVRTASLEIASGNHDLSDRTSQQASSLEQTAAAMEEITSTVQHNADNASQAANLASDASRVAGQGGAVMQQVVHTMDGIDASARKIVDIIGVIDGIAFQTNILALNAAVEAARAGEQGRGFAVVAGEVRTLAQRSATAAREIKTLIESSVDQIRSGNSLVRQAGGTMDQVVGSVERVTSIVGEIDLASQEQRTGISEIGNAIGLMDNATQQNAALVEQAAAAAQTLQEQAAHLAQLVGGFKLDSHEVASHATTRGAPQVAPGAMLALN